MRCSLLFVIFLLLGGFSARAEESYEFGVPVECDVSSNYSSFPVEVEVTDFLSFLIGPDFEDLKFTSGRIGDEIRAGSNGAINLARNSFGLSLEAEHDEFLGFRGTIEIRQPKSFCSLVIGSGVVLELKAAGLDVASIKLVARETKGLAESPEAKLKTIDRIGWKYFLSFKRYLSDDYEWVEEWHSARQNPFDFETYKYGFGFETSNDRRRYSYAMTERLEYLYGGAKLLKFLEENELYLKDFPDSKFDFRLSEIGQDFEYHEFSSGIMISGRSGSKIGFAHGDQGVHPRW